MHWWPMVATTPSVASQANWSGDGVCQTASAGTSDTGVMRKTSQKTMALGCASRDSSFTAVWLTAISMAENSTSSAAPVIVAKPGLRTIMAPAKPTAMAVQRRARIVSPSVSTAAIEANSGMVKLSAVASASGMRASA